MIASYLIDLVLANYSVNEAVDCLYKGSIGVVNVPVYFDDHLSGEARQNTRGISLGKKFFLLDIEQRYYVLLHELGHWFREEYVPLQDIMGWKEGEGFYNLFGSGNSEEGFADAFMTYLVNPDELQQRYPEAYVKIQEWVGSPIQYIRWGKGIMELLPTDYPIDEAVDYGLSGKQFESVMIKALQMVGLDFDINRASGAIWDIKTKGDGWTNFVSDKPVNIKLCDTAWVFGSGLLGRVIDWDTEVTDIEKMKRKIRKIILDYGLPSVVFLRAKDKKIQDAIISAVNNNDADTLRGIFIRRNFDLRKIGKFFDVKINMLDGKMNTIAVLDKDGKVFMRSEKPRMMKGTNLVGFRSPDYYTGVVTNIANL